MEFAQQYVHIRAIGCSRRAVSPTQDLASAPENSQRPGPANSLRRAFLRLSTHGPAGL